jgi:hypothetical protein
MTEDRTPEERAALLTWHLAHGDAFKTRDAASMTGMTARGARRLLGGMSRVLPIYQDENGFWQVLAFREADV